MVHQPSQPEPSYLELAVRAWTQPLETTTERSRATSPIETWLPNHVLVFDTETTIDETQALNFGSWRFYRIDKDDRSSHGMVCVDEGLFFGEDLRDRYPDGYETLLAYRAANPPDVDSSQTDAAVELQLLSQREFVDEVLINAAFELRAWIVGFNLPFDLSRVAYGSGYASKSPFKDVDRYEGGFSLPMAMYRSEEGKLVERKLYRPRVAIKTIDSKRHLIGLRSPAEVDEVHLLPDPNPDIAHDADTRHVPRGHFLDVRTLAFALTDQSYSLERACKDFHVEHPKLDTEEHGQITPEYIEYNRRDVKATAELYERLMDEYLKHNILVSPTSIYSPASIGRAYLDQMNIRPVLANNPSFPNDVLGYAMAAYYGGRAECRIRRVELPVVYCDFLAMYPTVNTLMGLWDYLTAEAVGIEETTEELRDFLDQLTLDDCFNPGTWKQLPALVLIQPDGDILPTRASYDEQPGRYQIGVNPLTSTKPIWYTLADAVASKILTGKTPDIIRGLRLIHGPKAKGLQPHRLYGQHLVSPETQDLFKTIIETRKSLTDEADEFLDTALKVLANATSYGIFAQIDRRELGADRTEPVQVYGLDGAFRQPNQMTAVETPGKFSFPPIAACITGAARLMLALVERLVADAGGSYTFCDTDSIAIVSTETGDTIPCRGGAHTAHEQPAVRAISWEKVDSIRARFDQIHPYNRKQVPGSILEIEKQNYEDDDPTRDRQQLYCYAISAKRYALYNRKADGQIKIRKPSQHGLGHLLNPTDIKSEDRGWISQVWEHIIKTEAGSAAEEPDWFQRPAVGRLSVSTPNLHKPFDNRNKTEDGQQRPYWEQVKPFNFMLTAHIDTKWKRPTDAEDHDRFHLIAPWNPDRRKWLDLDWIDRYSQKRKTYKATTTGTTGSRGVAVVSTYGSTISSYRTQPEAKSLDPETLAAARGRSEGILKRRPVTITAHSINYIGKESNQLEEVEAGIHHDPTEITNQYDDPQRDDWTDIIRPALLLAVDTGLTTKAAVAASAGGVQRSTAGRWYKGETKPQPKNMQELKDYLAGLVRDHIDRTFPHDALTRIAMWLEITANLAPPDSNS